MTNQIKKPVCKLVGKNGNVFNLIGIVKRTLIKNGLHAEAAEMQKRALSSLSYGDVLAMFMDYVDVE